MCGGEIKSTPSFQRAPHLHPPTLLIVSRVGRDGAFQRGGFTLSISHTHTLSIAHISDAILGKQERTPKPLTHVENPMCYQISSLTRSSQPRRNCQPPGSSLSPHPVPPIGIPMRPPPPSSFLLLFGITEAAAAVAAVAYSVQGLLGGFPP